MSSQIAKLGMSKNIRTRDEARHFVTKITLPKASDVHMELAEWLVHWAPQLASRVRCSTRSSP